MQWLCYCRRAPSARGGGLIKLQRAETQIPAALARAGRRPGRWISWQPTWAMAAPRRSQTPSCRCSSDYACKHGCLLPGWLAMHQANTRPQSELKHNSCDKSHGLRSGAGVPGGWAVAAGPGCASRRAAGAALHQRRQACQHTHAWPHCPPAVRSSGTSVKSHE